MTLQSPNYFAINITNSSVTKQLFLPHLFFSLPSTILHRENVKGGNSPPQHPAKSCPAHNYHGFDCNYWQQLNLMTEFLKMDKLAIKLEKQLAMLTNSNQIDYTTSLSDLKLFHFFR